MEPVRVTVLADGRVGPRFIAGVQACLGARDRLTVIANTADDHWFLGLRICPDLDEIMTTLSPHGLEGPVETWNAQDVLTAHGTGGRSLRLSDRALATCLVRTDALRSGKTLTQATRRLMDRWELSTELLPMSDDELQTRLRVEVGGHSRVMSHAEYWERHQGLAPVTDVRLHGLEIANPAPGVMRAVMEADVVLLPPADPAAAMGPLVRLAGLGAALRTTTAPIIGVSPVVGKAAVPGASDELMVGLGLDVGAPAVAAHYGSRRSTGVLDGWLVDSSDLDRVRAVEELGVECRTTTIDVHHPETMARDALQLAAAIGHRPER
ncbi:hypothetical protein ASD11_01075 [Aeromicrobium sp. Root495]|nr:hypothetical protein ASD11_01075 [Aeromicrobium sp. Root495]